VTVAASWIRAGCDSDRGELDAEMLAGCRAGRPAALRGFVVRYQHLVFAYLSRTLGAGPHVEDLAQEVFLRACRGLSTFDAGGAARPSTWLLTIASRVAIDARRRRRVPTSPLDAELAVPSSDTPETERRRAELGQALARAAAQLTDEQRDVFVLAEFHDLDTKAIAAVLGVREATARTRLFRARERLRQLLQHTKEEL
jgi:RNA polymerase sigma-70 factor (ECF subfamily)